MTELAAGAVSSLLVVVRNEALLLGGVRDDVQFIKEEMESMKSFLAHLARSTPPGREHDEQVQTWMNQVRLLAQDCHNCIDLYLYSGNPDIHRAKGRLRRYLWWVYWFLRKLLAQHRAAVQLRQLKDRARDVGERRLRYGVEVPGKSKAATASSSSSSARGGYEAAAGDDNEEEEDDGDNQLVSARATSSRTLDDYLKAKLWEWQSGIEANAGEFLSMVMVAPYRDDQDLLSLLQETLVSNPKSSWYQRIVWVDIPAVHIDYMPLRAEEVLFYILRKLKQEQAPDEEDYKRRVHPWEVYKRRVQIHSEKMEALALLKIEENIEKMKVYQKLGKIKTDIIEGRKGNSDGLPKGDKLQGELDQLDLGVLLQLLFQEAIAASQQDQGKKNKDMHMLPARIAKKLKEHMEAEEKDKVLEEEEVTKHMELEEGEATGKNTEEEDTVEGEGEVTKHTEEEEAAAVEGREIDEHMVEGEGEVTRSTEEEEVVAEEVGEIAELMVEGEGEVTKHTKEGEETAAVEGEGEVTRSTEEEVAEEVGEIAELMVEGEGEVTKRTDEEEAAAAVGGEINEHMVKGGGEVTRTMEEEEEEEEVVAEAVGEIAELMVEGEGGGEEIKSQHTTWIHLDEAQYAHILHNLFPKSNSSSSRTLQAQDRSLVGKQAIKATTATLLGEDEIKQIIHNAKKDILRELQELKYGKGEGTGESAVPDQNPETVSEKIGQMIDNMNQEFEKQLKIKGLVEEIRKNLNDHRWRSNKKECTLFILKVDELMDVSTSTWEDTRNALSLLKNSSDMMIVTTTNEDIQVAKEYCYPPREPIDYSLAGLYHDTILELISSQHQRQNNGDNCYHPQIFHDILDECEPHEFCMKIFTHALYANPKRSNEELLKLHSILQDLPTSFNSVTKVMFKFAYNDLPKEYKSCLLYLAIFPPGHKIRRSTLIGRWVAEGLTSKEDWHSSVRQANRCFDALVDRFLVYPADIGATGNVKSCVVGEPIHGIIATIARKQHILETRLSHHLARHFSVFNDLQLRSSDGIDKFFQGLSRSSWSVLKLLDLEGCKCFGGKNQRYLKDICRKMLLLKYLSLRRTDITQLPREINNLRELEVLDIRQTKVPPQATASILLLKLKRLLASHVGPKYPTIPHKIYKMVNMEVLSNVKAQYSRDLQDIGKLWQLRKLGVVIDDKDSHLEKLLQTISDLYECLRSLSITTIATPTPGEALGTISNLHECLRSLSITTIPVATPTPCEALGTTTNPASAHELPADGNGKDIGSLLKNHPKILQSLTIRGTTTTHKGSLLSLFTKGNKNILAKVTLSDTQLSQDDLKALAKLPMLRCVRLQHIACTENMLTFKKEEFICLKYLLVESSDLTNITFEEGSACKLEKMVLSFTSIVSISGVCGLPKLQELELNNSFCGRLLSLFYEAEHIAKLTLRGTELEEKALQILAEKRNIRSLVLLERSFGGRQDKTIIFKKDEFLWLNLLEVNCSSISKIVFERRSAPRLEKIVWSSSTSLSGIDNLTRLKELEFKGGQAVPDEMIEAIDKHQNKPSLKLSGPETQG